MAALYKINLCPVALCPKHLKATNGDTYATVTHNKSRHMDRHS